MTSNSPIHNLFIILPHPIKLYVAYDFPEEKTFTIFK